MPRMYRRFRRRRRRYNRVRLRYINRQRLTRTYARAALTSWRPYLFKLRRAVAVASDVNGEIAYNFSNQPNVMSDWSSLTTLFDNYRVTFMKIKWVPIVQEKDTSYQAMYVFFDPDTAGLPITSGNIDQALEYENCRVFNIRHPFTYGVKNPRGVGVLQGGYYDIANPIAYCSINLFSGNQFNYPLPASTDMGQLIMTLYIACKNRR